MFEVKHFFIVMGDIREQESLLGCILKSRILSVNLRVLSIFIYVSI